jgi:hypothetical protein
MPLFSVLERPAGARLPSSSSFLLAASSSLRTSCIRSSEVNEVSEVTEINEVKRGQMRSNEVKEVNEVNEANEANEVNEEGGQ